METGCLVEGLELKGRRASGVRWRQNGELRNARCRGEVILAGGAIGSPHLLMLSGIGPAAQLSQFAIPIVLDKPGVGANLHDHLQLRMVFKVSGVKTLNETYANLLNRLGMGIDYALRRRGPMTMAPSQLGAFTRSDPSQATANIQYHVQPLSLDKFGEPLHPFPAFTASVANIRPTSRGRVTLKSKDPSQAPAISPNYLATPEDRRVAADSIHVTRKIVGQPALRKYSPIEHLPGPSVRDDDEPGLVKAAGDIGTTIFHPVGTARMGRDDDPRAVVDARLRVIGIDRLRVVDASVMPSITSGNTNSPTMMIAEKGAAMILEDQKRLH
jgi:choline dehydrogenase-like flavoprotein